MSGLNDDVIAAMILSVGPDSARDLVGFFLEESRERLRRMEDQIATDNLLDLARDAHSLKSAAATYGADALSDLARAVEMACRNGDVDAIERTHRDLTERAGDELDALGRRFAELMA